MRSVSFPLVRALITPSKIDVIITEILEINVNLKVLKKAVQCALKLIPQ